MQFYGVLINKTQIFLNQRLPALASRDFILFLIGQLISVIGTWMQATALPYLAYRISGRPLDLGLIGFSTTLPTLLFALPAGVFVERWDKRKAVIFLQALMSIQAFGLAFLTFTGQIQIWHITLLAFLYGSAVAVEVTARQAMLIELAGREALPNAIALQTTAFNLGRVLGPLCAAWLISATGNEGSVFLANGISFVFVIAGLFLAKTDFKAEESTDLDRNLRREFKEGLAYIRGETVVMSVIILSALFGFFGMPLIQQIPAFARDVLRTVMDTESIVAARTSSLYAAQGVGALVAAFLAASWHASNKDRMLLLGQVTFILPIIGLGFTLNTSLALILLTFIGWGTVTQLVTMNTIIQTRVPNRLRGRVFSIYFWALQGVAPFGSIFIGWIAQTWNVRTAAFVGGTICLLGVLVVRLIFTTGQNSLA
ncbi:MAG TPA: MFS transporter, partial [Anaerolineales bacterium]|nr:MFS transporter [Anaerolineales bacterium]